MNIKILSRTRAVKLSYTDFANDKVIISIKDSWAENAHFNRNNSSIKEILYLSFYDISEETKDIFGGYNSMSPDDALKIAYFVNKWKDKVDTIWVHCEVGVSRSAGIAMAIMEYLNMDLTPITKNPIYRPNMLCYELTKGALYEQKYEERIKNVIIGISELNGTELSEMDIPRLKKVIIKNILEAEDEHRQIEEAIERIAAFFEVNAEELCSNKRTVYEKDRNKFIQARRVAIYYLKKKLNLNISQLANSFNCHFELVLYIIESMDESIEKDEPIKTVVEELVEYMECK